MDVALDFLTGYILEINLEYPQHLHDAYADLPFYPTHNKPPGKREDKFFAMIRNITLYIIETCSNVLVVFG